MREWFLRVFGDHLANEYNGIKLYSWAHLLYIGLILTFATIICLVYIKKEKEKQTKMLDTLAISILVIYIADFFPQPFWNGGTLEENGRLALDKFPFHICVILCPLIMFSRFSKKGQAIKTPVATLATLAPFMWFIYPGTALDTNLAFYTYRISQLFLYHGVVFTYGISAIITQDVILDIKKCYKEAICLIFITLWASFGNAIYSCEAERFNWFFLKDPVFSFIPHEVNALAVVVVMYLSCLFVYGVKYLTIYLYNKHNLKKC